ncbi:sulfite exporter TauE/SafE family protein [Mycolicibacterium palauense]|uniref:sulfite exporter TauE/SafE family protein n=1 Tax=Mycolicibacterium palauense TaxID=2034511 RepID=UPI000BFF0870|nr:sulfite exporter TauE/SafE family protein [Mycolicibacterium palauense]
MISVAIALAAVVGVSLGLLGGGGSILMVPLLTAVAGLDAKPAIATSLLVVGVTSAIAAVTHARAGRVKWRIAAVFGAAAMAGAFGGGILARFVPGAVLLIAFAVIMLAAGVAMLRGRRQGGEATHHDRLPVVRLVLLGLAVGLISGLVGAGGGFLLVPALTLLADLPMPVAVGTSLVVIAMQSLAGFLGHLASDHVEWGLAAGVTAAAVLGSVVGGWLAARVDATLLRSLFGWFVLLMAGVVLAQQAGPAIGGAVGAVTVLSAAVVATRAGLRRRRSRHSNDGGVVIPHGVL